MVEKIFRSFDLSFPDRVADDPLKLKMRVHDRLVIEHELPNISSQHLCFNNPNKPPALVTTAVSRFELRKLLS